MMNTLPALDLSVSFEYGLPEKSTRGNIMRLEAALLDLPDAISPQGLEDELVEHFFAPGTYGRKMLIPAGFCIVGKIHRHAHINVITKGVIKVKTEFGDEVIAAPRVWVSEPGTKRAVYALEDTEWLTLHANPGDTQDIREIEQSVIVETFEEFDGITFDPRGIE